MNAKLLLLSLSLVIAQQPTCDKVPNAVEPKMESSTISMDQLPTEFDTTRTYEYDFSQVNADSILTVLLDEGIPVSRAWLPLDDRCANPLGPRFTVELTHEDSRIIEHQFRKGIGRLYCATMLREFIILQ